MSNLAFEMNISFVAPKKVANKLFNPAKSADYKAIATDRWFLLF